MFSEALSFAKKSLDIEYRLKDKQLQTLQYLYEGEDCISVLPTGYGKSVIFQLLPWLFQYKRRAQTPLIVIIVCPLNSLMQDQVMTLSSKGVSACYLSVEGKKPIDMIHVHPNSFMCYICSTVININLNETTCLRKYAYADISRKCFLDFC